MSKYFPVSRRDTGELKIRGRHLILSFFAYTLNINTPESFIVLAVFSTQKLARLFPLKEAKPSPDRQMVKFLTFDNLSFSLKLVVD